VRNAEKNMLVHTRKVNGASRPQDSARDVETVKRSSAYCCLRHTQTDDVANTASGPGRTILGIFVKTCQVINMLSLSASNVNCEASVGYGTTSSRNKFLVDSVVQ
jgi:hypothetical protein